MIINAGISQVVFNSGYPLGDRALSLLEEAGVELRKFEVKAYDEKVATFEKVVSNS